MFLNIFFEAPNTLKTAISFFLSLNIAVKLILKIITDSSQIATTKIKTLVARTFKLEDIEFTNFLLNIAKIPSFDSSFDIFEANFTESTPGFTFIITEEITSSSATLLAVILSEALANFFAVF